MERREAMQNPLTEARKVVDYSDLDIPCFICLPHESF
jgi:hypothetical protein